MTVALYTPQDWLDSPASFWVSSTGLSAAAQDLRRMEREAITRAGRSVLERPKRALYAALVEAVMDASTPNWDGYGAAQANPAAFLHAIRFLNYLPASLAPPEVTVDADGDIGLDWDYGPRRIFSLRISQDGTIYFAGMRGNLKYHGSVAFLDGIPKAVADGIESVVRAPQH